MNINEYIRNFKTFENSKSFSGSDSIEALRIIYKNDRQVLFGQVHRYLEVLRTYKTLYGDQEVIIARAPGRVDLMGSHTDYHQGYVLPMALDKDTVVVAGKRRDKKIALANTDDDFPPVEFELEPEIPRSERGSWENYVKAAAQAFICAYGLNRIDGMDAVVAGRSPYSVPVAAGLSSSSALLIAAAVALVHVNEIAMEPKHFARFCGEAEWYVGTRGGFMDHFTSILNRKDHALFLDCRPVKISGKETFITKDIPLPKGYDIAICNTNVRKEKSASSEYNTRALECKLGVELLKSHFPDAQYLRDIPTNTPLHTFLPAKITLDGLKDRLDQNMLTELFQDYNVSFSHELRIFQRCHHVISENARVLKGCELLNSGDMEAFGELMIESYQSIREDFEASCAELDQMIEIVLRVPGTIGARIAGAGWGGCAVVIVRTSESLAFQRKVAEEYYKNTGIQPGVFICHPNQGAGVLQISQPKC
jgi:galactokinase